MLNFAPVSVVLLRCSQGTVWSWVSPATLVVLALLLTTAPAAARRNSKFARNWEMLDRLHPGTNIKRHIVERTR